VSDFKLMVTLPICSFSDKYVLTLCLYYCLSFSSSSNLFAVISVSSPIFFNI